MGATSICKACSRDTNTELSVTMEAYLIDKSLSCPKCIYLRLSPHWSSSGYHIGLHGFEFGGEAELSVAVSEWSNFHDAICAFSGFKEGSVFQSMRFSFCSCGQLLPFSLCQQLLQKQIKKAVFRVGRIPLQGSSCFFCLCREQSNWKSSIQLYVFAKACRILLQSEQLQVQ